MPILPGPCRARSYCDPPSGLSTLAVIGSENRIMTLSRPCRQQRIERLPTADDTRRVDDLGMNRLPLVDVRVVLFTVSDGRLFIALQEQFTRRALPRGSLT